MSVRILLVERNATTADLLVPGLRRKGYQVFVARSQRQATDRIRSHRPDLLIVDVASFAGKGYQVSEMVRARLLGTPTILLLDHGHASAGSTADSYMTPPFTSRKLLYRVKRLAENLSERLIRAGPLSLDPDTRMLHRGKRATQLRPKEAALLAYFMRNPSRVLSRLELMQHIWDTDYMDDTRTLSVHVRWLRQRIEDDPSKPRLLRTVRGVGYRFEAPDTPPPD